MFLSAQIYFSVHKYVSVHKYMFFSAQIYFSVHKYIFQYTKLFLAPNGLKMAERPWDYSVIEAWSRCLIDRASLAGITAKVGNCHLLFAQIVEQKLKQRHLYPLGITLLAVPHSRARRAASELHLHSRNT